MGIIYPCPDCDRSFPAKRLMTFHYYEEHGVDSASCAVCSGTTVDSWIGLDRFCSYQHYEEAAQ